MEFKDVLEKIENEREVKQKVNTKIERFYYKKPSCSSLHSSVSLDGYLVHLLDIRLGSRHRVREWVRGQALILSQNQENEKSISRKIQENAIRIVADGVLIEKMSEDERLQHKQQMMMAQWLGKKEKRKKK